MKTIGRRLQKLEQSLALEVENRGDWGGLANARDEILRQAERTSESHEVSIRVELDTLGPSGLWCEAARSFLADHGFLQSGDESFAETIARVLGIGTDQLRALIAQGQITSALWGDLARFDSY